MRGKREVGGSRKRTRVRRTGRQNGRGGLLDVVEGAYDLAQTDTDHDWARRIADTFSQNLDRGHGVGCYFSETSGVFEAVLGVGLPDGWEQTMAALMRSELGPDLLRPPRPATTLSKGFGVKRWLAIEAVRRFWSPRGAVDGLGVVADDGGGRFATFFAPMSSVGTLPPRVARELECVAVHISAAWRLRRSLRKASAMMTSSGKVLHAEGDARTVGARQMLRDAARAVERARGPLRRTDPSEALALWRALVSGRWSIVDQFESDGKRYLVAHENAPSPPGPAALDTQERQILAFTAMGHSLKLMAYELGISMSTISHVRSIAMRKMRLKTRADIARLLGGSKDAS